MAGAGSNSSGVTMQAFELCAIGPYHKVCQEPENIMQ